MHGQRQQAPPSPGRTVVGVLRTSSAQMSLAAPAYVVLAPFIGAARAARPDEAKFIGAPPHAATLLHVLRQIGQTARERGREPLVVRHAVIEMRRDPYDP